MCCNHRRTPSAVRHRPMTRRSRTRIRRQLTPLDSTNMPADLQDHVACLLEPDDDGDAGGATLTALLAALPATQESISSPSPASSSTNWDGDEEGLARRALRGRERWIFCRSSASDEVASGGGFDMCHGAPTISLKLKLDYEEVLIAWSGRGSLYIDGDGPQIVPEPHDATVLVEVGSFGNAWRVPELGAVKEEEWTAAEEKEAVAVVASREARVLRYKEKRRSRLFAKRIRYEVRKLNAEKRPRMKGRFVKRKDDEK